MTSVSTELHGHSVRILNAYSATPEENLISEDSLVCIKKK